MNSKIQSLVEEIRKDAAEISSAKTYEQILSLHHKIQQLYENSIVLKSLAWMDNEQEFPIPSSSPTLASPQPTTLEKIQPAPVEKTAIPPKSTGGFEFFQFEKPFKSPEETASAKVNSPNPAPSQAQKNLIPLQVSLNDKVAFISYLFGNIENTNAAIDAFNQLDTFEESMAFIDELAKRFDWKGKEEYVNRLRELVLARFGG